MTVVKGTPALLSSLAQPCRRWCRCTVGGRPARFTVCCHRPASVVRRTGPPLSAWKISPSSPGGHAARCAARASAANTGSGREPAASYRRRLRDTEGERDRLAEQVAGYQRREVEALAERGRGHDRLASGTDLWVAGVRVADLLDESGAVDPDKAHAAVAAVLT